MKGSLHERQPGVWVLRVYTGRRDNRGHPVQRARTFRGGKREAESALAKFVTEVQRGQIEASGAGATVEQLLDRWLLHIAKNRTPQTVKGYRSKVDKRLKPALGKMRLDKLRASHIDQAMTDWGEELSPATVRQLYAILAAALHQAHKWGWVDEIVTKKASPPKVERRPSPVPSPDELRALIAGAEGVLAAAIALAAATGCRRGELCALRWSDVDRRGVLTVSRSLGWVNGQIVEGGTKTHQVRRLALDDFGLAVIARRMDEQRELAEKVGVELCPDPYLLSRTARGTLPCLPDGLSHSFSALCKKLGMGYHFHQLRHWAATMALSEGHDVRTVAGRLGHADASTTLKVYAHVVEARDQELAGTLGRMLKA